MGERPPDELRAGASRSKEVDLSNRRRVKDDYFIVENSNRDCGGTCAFLFAIIGIPALWAVFKVLHWIDVAIHFFVPGWPA